MSWRESWDHLPISERVPPLSVYVSIDYERVSCQDGAREPWFRFPERVQITSLSFEGGAQS